MDLTKQTKDFPETFYALIEIPVGSNCKYEYDEELEGIKLDRVLFTAMTYPTNYGFVLNTEGKDGDPLDVMVISSTPIASGMLVKCRAIGIAEMEDEEGQDNKVIAVPVEKVDPASSTLKETSDMPAYSFIRFKARPYTNSLLNHKSRSLGASLDIFMLASKKEVDTQKARIE